MNNKFFIILFCYFSQICISWGQSISGIIMDEKSVPLAYTNVIVRDSTENVIVNFGQANNKGEYSINITPGKWNVEFSLLSYENIKLTIIVEKQEVIRRNIIMHSSSLFLDEVEITPQIPIQERGDTVVFNITSFLRGNERVIEDVIKNLPGIEVNDNGTIYANGKEIEKVLLEGDDLLNKGYSLLTKGLSVLAVNQIELIDKYTENKLTKGIIESDKIALNLKLDESAKHQWIGMTDALAGIKNKYEGHISLLKAEKRNKYYFIGHLNNTGEKVIDDLLRVLNQENKLGQLIKLENEVPSVDYKRYNFNHEKIVSNSNIWHPSSNIQIEMSNNISTDSKEQHYKKTQIYKIDTISYTNELERKQRHTPLEYAGNVKVDIDVQDSSKLTFATRLHIKKEKQIGNSFFNGVNMYEDLKNSQLLVSQTVNYTNRLSPRELLTANATYKYQDLPQEYNIKSKDKLNESIKQSAQYRHHEITANAGFLKELNQYNSIQYSMNYQFQNNIFETLLSDDNKQYMNSQNSSFDLSFVYHYISKCIEFKGGSTIELQQIKMNDYNHYFVYPLPFVDFKWNIGKRNIVRFTWASLRNIPEWTEYFPYTIRSSIDTQIMGTGQPDLLSDMVCSVEYQYGNWQDIFLANLNFSYIKSNVFYGMQQCFDSNIITTQYIPLKNKEMYSLSGSIDYYIHPISSNLKLKGNYDKILSKHKIQNIGILPYHYNSYYIGASLKSILYGNFNFDFGCSYLNISNKFNKIKFNKINSFANLFFSFDKIQIELKGSITHIKNSTIPQYHPFLFVDSKLTYDCIPNVCSISIRGNNLTNTKEYSEDIYNDISYTHMTHALQAIHILVGVEYRF